MHRTFPLYGSLWTRSVYHQSWRQALKQRMALADSSGSMPWFTLEDPSGVAFEKVELPAPNYEIGEVFGVADGTRYLITDMEFNASLDVILRVDVADETEPLIV